MASAFGGFAAEKLQIPLRVVSPTSAAACSRNRLSSRHCVPTKRGQPASTRQPSRYKQYVSDAGHKALMPGVMIAGQRRSRTHKRLMCDTRMTAIMACVSRLAFAARGPSAACRAVRARAYSRHWPMGSYFETGRRSMSLLAGKTRFVTASNAVRSCHNAVFGSERFYHY